MGKGHQNNNGTTPSTPCHTKGDQTNINTDDVSQLAEGVESKDKGQSTGKNPSTVSNIRSSVSLQL